MANKKDRLTTELSRYVGLGQWAKAVQTLQSLINLEPTNTHYYLRMGDYSLKAGNKAAAIKYYYQAADMYARAGFAVKAIATYKMILKIAPNETQATLLMKTIHAGSGLELSESALAELQQSTVASKKSKSDPASVKEPDIPEIECKIAQPSETTREEARPQAAHEPKRQWQNVHEPASPLRPSAPEPLAPPMPAAAQRPRPVFKAGETKNINQLFANFTQDEFGAIVDKLEQLEFMDGERIVSEGDEGDGMYLITRGGGKVVTDHKGQEVELCELGEGEFFGEMSPLASGQRNASVFAKGETEALRLRSADLSEVMKQYPRLETVLEEFSRAMQQKMRELPE